MADDGTAMLISYLSKIRYDRWSPSYLALKDNKKGSTHLPCTSPVGQLCFNRMTYGKFQNVYTSKVVENASSGYNVTKLITLELIQENEISFGALTPETYSIQRQQSQ